MQEMINPLREELSRFRRWQDDGAADVLDLGHGAEWESNYPHWGALLAAVQTAIAETGKLDEESISLVLFVLARDNEDEAVADTLRATPATLARLLPAALNYPDPQARWQIASILPAVLGAHALEPLCHLNQDPDEYVRRRASIALDELQAT